MYWFPSTGYYRLEHFLNPKHYLRTNMDGAGIFLAWSCALFRSPCSIDLQIILCFRKYTKTSLWYLVEGNEYFKVPPFWGKSGHFAVWPYIMHILIILDYKLFHDYYVTPAHANKVWWNNKLICILVVPNIMSSS